MSTRKLQVDNTSKMVLAHKLPEMKIKNTFICLARWNFHRNASYKFHMNNVQCTFYNCRIIVEIRRWKLATSNGLRNERKSNVPQLCGSFRKYAKNCRYLSVVLLHLPWTKLFKWSSKINYLNKKIPLSNVYTRRKRCIMTGFWWLPEVHSNGEFSFRLTRNKHV